MDKNKKHVGTDNFVPTVLILPSTATETKCAI
jgi:hypothetical protein